MRTKRIGLVTLAVLLAAAAAAAAASWAVIVQNGDKIVKIDLSLESISAGGTVAYEGPATSDGAENWKSAKTYHGIPVAALLSDVGGMAEGDVLSVIAGDGYAKKLPYSVIYGNTPAGTPILGLEVGSDGESAPTLVFLAPDERFSNTDMLAALGTEYSHYYGGTAPSTTGLLVKGVAYLIVNYDGMTLPTAGQAATVASGPAEGVVLTLTTGSETRSFTMSDLGNLESVTAPGTFTTSAGVDYTATYSGVPFSALLGNAPSDGTVRVSASDGYSMNYPVSQLFDRSAGTWILAYMENGWWMPLDPGYLRVVQVGDNPHFKSSLSARMVTKIEVLGTYAEYALTVSGETTRVFTRGELEAGIGCPCHTASVTTTMKGVTATYSGLTLWRLLAYVDGGTAPAAEQGIHYENADFNDALVAEGYSVVLTASDGYTQTVPAHVVARDDRFIVAFKKDGVFLDPSSEGSMRFVYDNSVVFPDGVSVKSVKFLTSIAIVKN